MTRPRKAGSILLLDDGTAWPDPRDGYEEIDDLIASLPNGPLKYRLRAQVSAYRHLSYHPAGTEAVVRSLRSLRRAMRATEVVDGE